MIVGNDNRLAVLFSFMCVLNLLATSADAQFPTWVLDTTSPIHYIKGFDSNTSGTVVVATGGGLNSNRLESYAANGIRNWAVTLNYGPFDPIGVSIDLLGNAYLISTPRNIQGEGMLTSLTRYDSSG